MALLTNRRNAAAYTAASIVGGAESWDSFRRTSFRNIYASEAGISDKSGIPDGSNTGGILLPLKPGGMAVYQQAASLTPTTADAKMGFPIQAQSAISLSVANAQADQIVSMAVSGAASIIVATAQLTAGVQASASQSLTMSGDATLGGIIPVSASASMSLSPNVSISALAFIEAQAGGPTPLSPEGLSAELLDNQKVESGFSVRESMRLMLATMAGKLSGSPGTSISIRNVTDTKTRISATVDASGNRSAVTYDVSD